VRPIAFAETTTNSDADNDVTGAVTAKPPRSLPAGFARCA
jgi:hypothetical protein